MGRPWYFLIGFVVALPLGLINAFTGDARDLIDPAVLEFLGDTAGAAISVALVACLFLFLPQTDRPADPAELKFLARYGSALYGVFGFLAGFSFTELVLDTGLGGIEALFLGSLALLSVSVNVGLVRWNSVVKVQRDVAKLALRGSVLLALAYVVSTYTPSEPVERSLTSALTIMTIPLSLELLLVMQKAGDGRAAVKEAGR